MLSVEVSAQPYDTARRREPRLQAQPLIRTTRPHHTAAHHGRGRLHPLRPDAAALLFTLIPSRHERASLTVKATRPSPPWAGIFAVAVAVMVAASSTTPTSTSSAATPTRSRTRSKACSGPIELIHEEDTVVDEPSPRGVTAHTGRFARAWSISDAARSSAGTKRLWSSALLVRLTWVLTLTAAMLRPPAS